MLTYLLFMRHAKSSWDDPALNDHERPLNKRGNPAAKAVGKALLARGYEPDLIVSSDAVRAKQTAKHIANCVAGNTPLIYRPDFYQSEAHTVLTACRSLDYSQASRLMLVGHNPAWGALYQIFSGSYHSFPSGACAVFQTRLDYQNAPQNMTAHSLSPEAWRPVDLILPRELDL